MSSETGTLNRIRPDAGPFRLGIIGDPVAHSLSPALHQPALDQLGIAATYERWHTKPADIEARIESLRDGAVLGASVTVPHKLAALRLVDEASPAARRAGAVNTIVNRDGRLFGDNTDIYGFATLARAAFKERIPAVALVLGAGGAARAVVLALEAMGVGDIIVVNRDPERGARLGQDLAPAPVRVDELNVSVLEQELPRADFLVNATSLGWHAGESPIDLRLLDLLPVQAVVADLTYRDTDLLMAASLRSLQSVDGLAMLVHQGAKAFELFTGRTAPLETMFTAARQARDGA